MYFPLLRFPWWCRECLRRFEKGSLTVKKDGERRQRRRCTKAWKDKAYEREGQEGGPWGSCEGSKGREKLSETAQCTLFRLCKLTWRCKSLLEAVWFLQVQMLMSMDQNKVRLKPRGKLLPQHLLCPFLLAALFTTARTASEAIHLCRSLQLNWWFKQSIQRLRQGLIPQL